MEACNTSRGTTAQFGSTIVSPRPATRAALPAPQKPGRAGEHPIALPNRNSFLFAMPVLVLGKQKDRF